MFKSLSWKNIVIRVQECLYMFFQNLDSIGGLKFLQIGLRTLFKTNISSTVSRVYLLNAQIIKKN